MTTQKATEDLETLYQYEQLLSEAATTGKIAQLEKTYLSVVESVKKPGIVTKKFSAQLIPKFFKYFPKLADRAINAQLDLCEDTDFSVRIFAIKGLPDLCKDTPEHLPKIADFLGQLLMMEETLEINNVKQGLQKLLAQNAKETLAALFNLVLSADDNLRQRMISYIKDRVMASGADMLQPRPEIERFLTDQIKKMLPELTSTEVGIVLPMLTSLQMFKDDNTNLPILLEMVTRHADLNAPFKPQDKQSVDRVLTSLNFAIPLFQRGVFPAAFMSHLGTKVLPSFQQLPQDAQRLNIVKRLAQMCPHASAQDARTCLPPLYAIFESSVPVLSRANASKAPSINFSVVECVLYSFHHLAAKAPGCLGPICGIRVITGQPSDVLDTPGLQQNLADFHIRLKALLQATDAYTKQLQSAPNGKPSAAPPTKPSPAPAKTPTATNGAQEALQTAAKTVHNIGVLARALLKQPPSFLTGAACPALSLVKPPPTAPPATKPTTATAAASRPASAAALKPSAASSSAAEKKAAGAKRVIDLSGLNRTKRKSEEVAVPDVPAGVGPVVSQQQAARMKRFRTAPVNTPSTAVASPASTGARVVASTAGGGAGAAAARRPASAAALGAARRAPQTAVLAAGAPVGKPAERRKILRRPVR